MLRSVLDKSRNVFILVGMIIIISLFSDVFLTRTNIVNILRQSSIIGVIACGMTLVIISGAIDLSVGSLLSFSSVLLLGQITKAGVAISLFQTFFLGIAIGCFTGSIIAVIKGKLGESFIVTFGMLSLLSGLAQMYTKGRTIQARNVSEAFAFIGKGEVFGLPMPTLIFFLVVVVFQIILIKTRYGRIIKLLGSNYEAVRLSGINVVVYRIISFGILGFTVALASLILTSRTAGAAPNAGIGYEFDVIAAVAIGGTSLAGGKGSVFSTFVGVLILSVLSNALTIMHINVYSQNIIKGTIILLAVYLDQINQGDQ